MLRLEVYHHVLRISRLLSVVECQEVACLLNSTFFSGLQKMDRPSGSCLLACLLETTLVALARPCNAHCLGSAVRSTKLMTMCEVLEASGKSEACLNPEP